MKKIFAILSTVFVLAACSESNIAEIENPQQEENVSTPVTFNITVQEQGATKALKTDWADGDVIYIRFNGINDKYIYITYNGSTSTWDVTESTPFNASDFEGKTLTLGAVHFPIDVEASFLGNNLQFKKDGQDIASYCMYQSNAAYTVDGINVTIKLSLQKPDNVVLFHVPGIQANASDYSLKVSAEETYVRAFWCKYIENDGSVTVTAKTSTSPIIGVADADGGLFCATYMDGNGLGSSKDYTLTVKGPVQEYTISGSLTLNAGYQYSLPALNDAKWTTKFKPFTVAAGKQVYIAPGNLQATTTDLGASWTWVFAPTQYARVGSYAANTTINGDGKVSANGTVDLFGWSTAATVYGINVSTSNSTYSGDFVDWGGLTIGSVAPNTWRTPTKAEWEWMIGPTDSPAPGTNCRTSSTVNSVDNARFAKAQLNNSIYGLIVFPDNYTHPDGVALPVRINDATVNNATNNYTYENWAAMERAGAVFLPAGGFRQGTTNNMPLDGYYWASTPYNTNVGYSFEFDLESVTHNKESRFTGLYVRLIHDID